MEVSVIGSGSTVIGKEEIEFGLDGRYEKSINPENVNDKDTDFTKIRFVVCSNDERVESRESSRSRRSLSRDNRISKSRWGHER